jgi:hypothetical protein
MDQDALISRLRAEANDATNRVTSLVFQAAALGAVTIGFVASTGHGTPWAALSAAPVAVVVALVCRIAIFKYTTANRNLGYQLHLERLKAYERFDSTVAARVESLRRMGWEEALQAWRIVHATTYAAIYTVPSPGTGRARFDLRRYVDPAMHRVRDDILQRVDRERAAAESSDPAAWSGPGACEWWNPRKLAALDDSRTLVAGYDPGSDLKDLLKVLNGMQWALYLCLWWPLTTFALDGVHGLVGGAYIMLLLLFGLALGFQQLWTFRRCAILEDGLLSVHPCATTWTAVAIAHVVAAGGNTQPYARYTERLAAIARHLDAARLPGLVTRYVMSGEPPFDKRTTFCEQALNRRRFQRRRYPRAVIFERRKEDRREHPPEDSNRSDAGSQVVDPATVL